MFDARRGVQPLCNSAADMQARMLILSSPNVQHWSGLNEPTPALLYMPLWSREELLFLAAACFPERNLESVEGAFYRWGGTPRNAVVPSEAEVKSMIGTKLAIMDFPRAKEIVGSQSVFVKGDDIVHSCLHVEVAADFEVDHVKFASPCVRDHVLQRAAKPRSEIVDFLKAGPVRRRSCLLWRSV